MDADHIARRMRQARERWHELDDPPRRALLIRRPGEVQMMRWRDGLTVERMPELVAQTVVDWRGFTEEDLLGGGVGGSDPVEFSRAVFDEWIGDRVKEMTDAATAVFELVNAHQIAQQAAAKN
jgi:hypothetical protein